MTLPADIPHDLSELDNFLAKEEARYDLKLGTEARIIWQPEKRHQQTDYALVYLHGFRASHPEGHPVHRKIADFLGANLFLSRLQEHGIRSENPLQNLTREKLLESARFAFAIGKKIGDKVILMGTSTGGSLALYLAAQPSFKNKIAGIILYSPLIRFFGIKEKLFLQHKLSRKILRFLRGGSHQIHAAQTTQDEDRIWDPVYALQGALALGSFVDHHMRSELFKQIECPVFIGYYYKNRRKQDKVVSVPAIKKMADQLNSDASSVYVANFPNAKTHVICNYLVSKSIKKVIKESRFFLKSIGLHGNNANTSN